ncbi:unnamed protein product, partial [Phaeothamnion confervicola]
MSLLLNFESTVDALWCSATVVPMRLLLLALISTSLALKTASDAEAETDFLRWFSVREGLAPAVSVAAFPSFGRGLLATQDVAAGEVLVSAPAGLVISQPHLATSANLPQEEKDVYATLRGDGGGEAIALFLMKQRALAEASEWRPYLACLPTAVPQTCIFAAGDLALLEDPRMASTAAARRNDTARRYSLLAPVLRRLLGAEVAAGEDGSIERFRWALSVVESRALTFRGEKMLVPLADMVNHYPHPELRRHEAGEFFAAHHVVRADGGVTVLADRPIAAGQQVFEDYGDNPDEASEVIYITYHGFVPREKNAFDCIHLELNLRRAAAYPAKTEAAYGRSGTTTASTTMESSRAALLARWGLPTSGAAEACVPESGELPAETAARAVQAAALWAMGADELTECGAAVDRAVAARQHR